MYMYVPVLLRNLRKEPETKSHGGYLPKVDMQPKNWIAFAKVIPPSIRPIFQGDIFVRAVYCGNMGNMHLRRMVVVVAVAGY